MHASLVSELYHHLLLLEGKQNWKMFFLCTCLDVSALEISK